jgi:sugar phosphate isomerase/epimerase
LRALDESKEDHLSLGDGKIDFKKVFDILGTVKYEWITLETMPSKPHIIQENLMKAKELVLNTKLL